MLKKTLLISAALLAVTGTAYYMGLFERPQPLATERTIIIGFDGMDFELTRQMMDAGTLPNFSELASRGHFGPLQTTVPPQSPVAWSSFATGTSPGDHGIYDFLRRDAASYQPAFSIAETTQPESHLSLFGLEFPLDEAQVINRRQGETLWGKVEQQGKRASVLRVPVSYPPEPIYRMMSGMGVPDLLGTQGTYFYYSTTAAGQSGSNGQTTRVRPDRTGLVSTTLKGPPHPLKPDVSAIELPLTIQPDGDGIRFDLDDQVFNMQPGEWSDWVPVSFPYFLWSSLDGMVRFHLIESYPDLKVYVTPIHIDPTSPAVPISSPDDYASDLADQIGMYHTIGMPEETWSLNSGHLSDKGFLEVIRTTLAEREHMFFDALSRRDSELLISVFVQTDRVSHMFYRGIDPEHPLHEPGNAEVNGAIEWIYQEADRILGQTMDSLQPEDKLIVVSDHGFAPFRRAVNLNRWLVENGYMHLETGGDPDQPAFSSVDWSRTRAYAVGLNGLYVNQIGRESAGTVTPEESKALLAQLSSELLTFRDEEKSSDVIKTIYQGQEIYPGNSNGDAPDLVIGYHKGYRASWQTAIGAIGSDLVHDNLGKWSGDHCIAADEVPGILLMSHPDESLPASIEQIAEHVIRVSH